MAPKDIASPRVRLNPADQCEGDHVADRPGSEQYSYPAGTGHLRKLGLHGNGNAARHGGNAFVGTQLANPVKRVQRGDRNTERHRYRN